MAHTLWMTLACATATPETPVAQEPAASPHPYSIEALPEEDQAALSRSLERSLGQVLSLHPEPVLASYQAAMLYGSKDCPRVDSFSQDGTTTAHWQDACYSEESQAWLNGPMTTWQWSEGFMDPQTLPAFDDLYQRMEPMRALRWQGEGLNGQTDIMAPDVDFNCSCLAIAGKAEDAGKSYSFIALDGPSHWSGPQAQGTWMEEGLQVQLSGFASQAGPQRELLMLGNISGLDPDFDSLSFELSLKESNGQCAPWNTTEQRIGARQSSTGHWVELLLPEFGEQSCMACTEGGDFCVDLSPLMDWQAPPW
jgi:hypothetical protein